MAIKTISVIGEPVQQELLCDAAITPGHLCERTATGAKVHATAGGSAAKLFALEDDLQGNEITDAYTAANQGQFGHFRPGDQVYALIADGENIAIGDWLESAGDGTLREVDADASVGDIVPNSVVAYAEEACDMSGSSGADPATARCLITIV